MNTTIAVALFLSQAALASAATMVSTFFPSGSYNENGGGVVGNYFGETFERAYSFTVPSSASYFLDGIEVAVGSIDLTQSSTITFNLKEDSAGFPGMTLESIQFSPRATTPYEGVIISGQSSVRPLLLAGHTYWLSANVASELPYMYWKIAGDGAVTWAARRDAGSWYLITAEDGDDRPGAFRISGTVVPEPSSGLLLSGMFVVLANRRRRGLPGGLAG